MRKFRREERGDTPAVIVAKAITCAAILGVIVGCATAQLVDPTPSQRLYDSYGKQLEVAVGVYTDALKATKSAHDAGLITNEQLEQVRAQAQKVRDALVLARDSMATFLEHGQGSPSTTMLDSQAAIIDLTKLLHSIGVLK